MGAEELHDAAVGFLSICEKFPALSNLFPWRQPDYPALKQNLWGIDFAHPVGLAAGWDKNAKVPNALASLGFGFLELGTVTFWPERGRVRPRIWRSFKDQWIANRVGFANEGAREISKRLEGQNIAAPLILSLGKMPASSADELVDEVSAMFELFYSSINAISVNVSSPNTPRGFELSRRSYLEQTLKELVARNQQAAKALGSKPKPLIVKVPPMLEPSEIEDTAALLLNSGVDGVIATNSVPTPQGGLSGLPLRKLALKTTASLHMKLKGKVPIIGVGGILTPEDAWERVCAGAALIQLFSGFVFSGPGLINAILEHMNTKVREKGMSNISQACGMEDVRLSQ